MSTFTEEHEAARAAVETALSNYLRIHNQEAANRGTGSDEHDNSLDARREGNAIITAWVAAFEWTNVGLEQDNAAVRDVVSNFSQPLSASGGLGQFIVNFYG
jgi:hypothetical protein